MEEETTVSNQTEDTLDNSENLEGAVLNTAQVNKIVQTRLQRQKKEHDRLMQDMKSELEAQTALLAEYEAQLLQIISKQVGDLPEAVKELFEKLTISEKMEWVSKHGQSGFEKHTIPETPKGSEGEKKFKPNTKNMFKI